MLKRHEVFEESGGIVSEEHHIFPRSVLKTEAINSLRKASDKSLRGVRRER